MFYITHRVAVSVKGIDVDGTGIVLLVHLEAQVSFENVIEEQHLIPIYCKLVITVMSCSVRLIIPKGRQKTFAEIF